MDIFSGDEEGCIYSDSIGILNCSDKSLRSVSDYVFKDIINNNKDTIELNQKPYIYSTWELFLAGQYQSESWYIIYLTPKNTLYGPIKSFAQFLLPLIILFILITTWFSYEKISSILSPLLILKDATNLIAKRDFRNPVIINTNDEFDDLAKSFNDMSTEISKQFSVMTAMSNLDRTLLSTANKEIIVNTIFKNISAYLNFSHASILLTNDGNQQNGDIYNYNAENKAVSEKKSIYFKSSELASLISTEETNIKTSKTKEIEHISWLNTEHSSYITTLISKQDKKLRALVFIHHERIRKLEDSETLQLNNFITHVNVALNAVERNEELVRRANFDELTGLPNRQYLINKFDSISSNIKNDENIAILFIDLDRFKVINDSQGHAVGDQLLINAANRIYNCVKKYGFVSRYGGDEFVVILNNFNDTNFVSEIADKIITDLSRKFAIDAYEQFIGASIGITLYPQDSNNWEDSIQKADIAMYKAKQNGRGKHLYFSDTMHSDIKEKAVLESDLFHSLYHLNN